MAKPRYKMVQLGTLKAGDVFWSYTSGRAMKGGKIYSTPRVPFRGVVVYQTYGGVKIKIIEGGISRLGTQVHTGKDRTVFVEKKEGRR